ncbi:jg24110 [Pararge aegeria aegeria]|uniref:Jg24110 protein n=1 Tax=Pararge aegeria aegeria TaxID=348720 RepID=A0A8S4QSS9_9NEOP|nr:jg24110 [Pararge aegeria aegeria]
MTPTPPNWLIVRAFNDSRASMVERPALKPCCSTESPGPTVSRCPTSRSARIFSKTFPILLSKTNRSVGLWSVQRSPFFADEGQQSLLLRLGELSSQSTPFEQIPESCPKELPGHQPAGRIPFQPQAPERTSLGERVPGSPGRVPRRHAARTTAGGSGLPEALVTELLSCNAIRDPQGSQLIPSSSSPRGKILTYHYYTNY